MKEYTAEDSAIYEWASVLDKFLSGNKNGAKRALATAMKNNPYTLDFLLDEKSAADMLVDDVEWDLPEEALECAQTLGYAWVAHPEALKWLAQMAAQDGR